MIPGPLSGFGKARAPLGINDGKGFVFVSHIGEIQPSGFLPITPGNVRTHELLEVYQHSPVFRELRDTRLLKGKCGRCEYRNICGGSRARAYALTGDYLGEEPLCAYEPGSRPGTAEPEAAVAATA
jgi:radical SAM protein with 4Fe4S-binding SPASM domain